jgi:hypothetical protein
MIIKDEFDLHLEIVIGPTSSFSMPNFYVEI